MSSGLKGAAARGRVSIPSSVRKTIENIKEITGPNHGDDEIYAMLQECSMDPNETAQKLLLLDTFHEVKKKRDRKKENLNKEPAESRWNPGSQARVSRPGRGNYSSRHVSHDASGRHALAVKHSSTSQISQKVVAEAPLANAQETKKNEASSSESSSGLTSQVTYSIHENQGSASGGIDQYNDTGNTRKNKLDGSLLFSSSADSSKNPDAVGTREIMQNEVLDSRNSTVSLPSTPASGSHFSSLDPILLPSQDVPLPSAVGTIGEMGSKHAPVNVIADNPAERTSASGMQQVPNDFQGVGKTQYVESVQTPPSTTGSSVSRPSSNYNNRSQVVGPQKAGPGKEWKAKSTTPSVDQDACTAASSEVSNIPVGNRPESQQTPEKATLELQRKLEKSQFSDSQNVIIPNHLQVPDAGKLGFCFGSFDASFGLDTNGKGGIGSEKSLLLPESNVASEQPAKELQLSDQTVLAVAENSETKHHDRTQSLAQGPEDLSSGDVEVSSPTTSGYDESKQEVTPGSHQHPVVHNSSYHYGFMPPILGSQLTPFETSESQARDVPRLPGFVVQQPFDPVSYYKQFYRSGIDSEGGITHLHSAVSAHEYNGNAAILSTQTSQFPQEVAAPPVVSTPSPVPLVTQAAGVMHSSITATQQQPLPIFRHPTGVHLTHYPPFIPYGPYLSPYYVPPPAIHQFLSNGAFQLQPHGGGLYPTPPGTTAKYSVSQHKQGSNTGSSTHIGMPGNYGPYGLSVSNYTSSSVTGVTSTLNEDLAAPQGKENNIYLNGQQNENSGLGQGQFAFAPTPPGRGPFTGIFHPAPPANLHPQSQSITIPIDMVGPTATVYHQQQQQAQLNWPSNF